MSAIALDVAHDAPGWEALPEAEALAGRALAEAAARAGVQLRPNAEVSLLLTGDQQIRGINKEWRGKDAPTNVLSFPAVPPDKLPRAPFLGDIAIAFETVQREAEAEGKLLADHFSHLVVHGFLHLLGYDHETDEEADAMEGLETTILASLGIADPYSDPAADPSAQASSRHDGTTDDHSPRDRSAGHGAPPLDGPKSRGRMNEGP